MLIILSPAKTLDFENTVTTGDPSQPLFPERAKELVEILKTFDTAELRKLMSISENLASLNKKRFKEWTEFSTKDSRQAICAFKGDVYTGLDVQNWDEADFRFAQIHIRILSGLYGVLRPLDLINPYRLEMGTKLPSDAGKTLYAFWGDLITDSINTHLIEHDINTVINLASNEYFKAVKTKKLKAEVITPVFKDFKNGDYKVISFYAKKARGMMSRFIVKNQITDFHQIKEFNDGGYYFNDRLSNDNQWVFTRDKL